MRNVFVCECIGFDSELYKKSYDQILNEIFNNPSDYSVYFVRMKTNEDLYVCCVRMIEFCYKCNRWFFFQ